jgi:hypothetical protein
VGNAGPADVVGATVTDTLPATLQSATWTCSASAGSGCTASGTGNISDTVDLLSGGTLTYSLTASVDLAATGSLANTATVAAAGTIDPDSSNNSATDTDTLLPPPPMVTPQAATSIGPEGATLTASVNPNGLATNVVFDYGPTVAYGSTTASNSLGSGSSPVATSSTVSGLLCNTQYHFRARATNASGTTNGGDLTFTTTAACKPARVFVSVLGADTNDCSNIATPCRTLNAAVAQVAFAGEVIVTRSGSYAGASITKSVKINAAAGVVAFSGQPVTVDPGAAGVVVIRGLTLKAITPGTGTGLSQLSGSLFVENSVIDGWSTGLNSAGSGRLYVENSTFRNNSEGIHLASSGSAAINGSSLVGNSFGGLAVDLGTVTVTGSTLSENGHGVFLDTGAVTLDKTQLANNATAGVLVAGPALARLTRCVVSGNGVGLNNGGGTLEVDGSNAVRGNTTNTSGTITTTSPQ